MSRRLIKHGTVVTMDPERRVMEDAAVLIEDDRIVALGADAAARENSANEVIDATHMLVMPGLIDCHAHAGHGLVKTLGADDGDAWYEACRRIYTEGSDEGFWGAEAALAALERLKFGVTCGVSLFGGGDSILRTDHPRYAAAHCEAVAEIGIRSMLAVGPCRPPFPWRFREWRGDEHVDRDITFERQIETCESIIAAWHRGAGGRVNLAIVSPTLRDEHVLGATPEAIDEMHRQAIAARELSRRHGLVFTQDGHTRGSVRYAHELGLLGPDALLSHSTDLSDEEIAICRDTDTRIAHNPSAVASIKGRCPVPELLDEGVTVGLGSDGTAPDRSGDMFRHMQQCMHYHRRHFRDSDVLPPGKVLEMATIDAARALGLDHEIGSIEPGKKADVILVDLYKPHTFPWQMPLYRAVYFANGNDVDTVIVDGRVLMRGRRVESVDESAILDAAQRESERAIARTGLGALTAPRANLFGRSHY